MIKDNLWMISTMLCPLTPLWSGWNAKLTEDHLPQQIVGYMDNICQPITRLDVVAETLRRSQRVAEECKQQYAIVTEDLAAAKLALNLQDTEAPLYDKCIYNARCISYFKGILCIHWFPNSRVWRSSDTSGVLCSNSRIPQWVYFWQTL